MNNGPKDLSSPATAGIVLTIKGLGSIPAIKNQRNAIVQPNGKARVLSDQRGKEWKKRAISLLSSQLLSGSAMSGSTTLTAVQLQSLIALLPADDRWRCIRRLVITSDPCLPGEEGATITIQNYEPRP